ncbi:YlcI/YnfO family protein [Buttiauxella gaviniae]|uniref:YlcI/YnfO family protein n=1 Tax=Buttiauxella gaviniae TaxID=82990 RepID=UPI003976CC74
MATKAINAKSAQKKIRFPHEMLEEIDASIEREKNESPSSNFSAWVLDACERKLKDEQWNKAKRETK